MLLIFTGFLHRAEGQSKVNKINCPKKITEEITTVMISQQAFEAFDGSVVKAQFKQNLQLSRPDSKPEFMFSYSKFSQK